MAKCKSCGKPVVWVRTVAGKNMPVDAEDMGGWEAPLVNVPDATLRPTGNRADNGRGGTVPVVETLGPLEAAAAPVDGERRFRSHFVTCADSREWSKRKRKAAR